MKLLVATARTQGARRGDYNGCVEGELVYVQEPCAADRADPDGPCGCGRGFSGMSSHRATTTARVADLAGFTRDDLVLALETTLDDGGWCPHDAPEIADVLLELAHAWPTGTVVGRRLDCFAPRAVQA